MRAELHHDRKVKPKGPTQQQLDDAAFEDFIVQANKKSAQLDPEKQREVDRKFE